MISIRNALAVAGIAFALTLAPAARAQQQVVIVTSFPKELTEAYKKAFEAKHPGDKLEVLNKNTVAPGTALPWTDNGWDTTVILTRLGQFDRIAGTDSDAKRCVQAVALASLVGLVAFLWPFWSPATQGAADASAHAQVSRMTPVRVRPVPGSLPSTPRLWELTLRMRIPGGRVPPAASSSKPA